MTDFAGAFQSDHNNISDAVEWDRSACVSGFAIPYRKISLFFGAFEYIMGYIDGWMDGCMEIVDR